MKDYLIKFMIDANWPKEAILSLTEAYCDICQKEKMNSVFTEWINKYEAGEMMNGKLYGQMLEEISKSAEECGINKYQAELLIFMCFSRGLQKLYEINHINREVFDTSMLDLRCKLYECHKMYGIWGSFVAGWFPGFFFLDRFALGRLQFEPITADFEFTDGCGRSVHKGDTVINVHIPSLGKLDYSDVTDSYAKAAEFFKDRLHGLYNDYTVFVCHSWLLFPKHREMLPTDSHIVLFMNDYTILFYNSQQLPGDMWRVFYSEYTDDFSKLPRNTTLQRAYADYLSDGNLPGEGFGVHII